VLSAAGHRPRHPRRAAAARGACRGVHRLRGARVAGGAAGRLLQLRVQAAGLVVELNHQKRRRQGLQYREHQKQGMTLGSHSF
jgi:hypothetical protein